MCRKPRLRLHGEPGGAREAGCPPGRWRPPGAPLDRGRPPPSSEREQLRHAGSVPGHVFVTQFLPFSLLRKYKLTLICNPPPFFLLERRSHRPGDTVHPRVPPTPPRRRCRRALRRKRGSAFRMRCRGTSLLTARPRLAGEDAFSFVILSLKIGMTSQGRLWPFRRTGFLSARVTFRGFASAAL